MSSEKQKPGGTIRAVRVLMVLLALCCVGVGAYIFLNPDTSVFAEPELVEDFAEGVSVAGVSLAGKTISEAKTVLANVEREIASKVQFTLSADNYSLTLTSADMPITFDTEEVLQKAFELGNTGTSQEREAEREALLSSGRDFPISYTIDVEAARGRIAELSETIKTEPVDASVEMDLNVDGWFRYTEGIEGVSLDEDALFETLKQNAEDKNFGVVELPLYNSEPEITVETLKATLVMRGRHETSFKKSPYNREDRVFNVKRASGLINGVVLKPGDTFFTNDTLGPRTYELGWKAAPAYVSGTTEDQAGGGVCQVSSTLYNAVVKADLEIVYRRNHSSPVGYVSRGLDATINTGTIDFQFKNNTASDIYIFSYTCDAKDGSVPEGKDDKTIHVEIYGCPLPDEYDEIKLSSTKLETLYPKGETEYVVDPSQPYDYYNEEVVRQEGSVWQSYKHYYKNGVEIKKEPLAKSTYRAYAGRIVVGAGYYYSVQASEQ